MTTLTDRYPDLLQSDVDPRLMRIVDGLDAMSRAATARELPSERDVAIREVLLARARERAAGPVDHHPARRRGSHRLDRRPYRPRVVSLAVATLAVLAGIAGYLRVQSPTPVSAAKVLHRAATALVPPSAGTVVHEQMTYTDRFIASPNNHVAAGSTYINTVEQWSRFASDSTVDRFSLTWVVNGTLEERDVLNDQAYWFYSGGSNSVTKDPSFTMRLETTPENVIWPKTIMTQPPNPAALRSLLLNAATAPDTQLLPQQTIDGRLVDVVQIIHREPIPQSTDANRPPVAYAAQEIFTLYIDSSAYTVRRIDQRDVDTNGATLNTGTLQLTTDESVPASQVPSNIFAFTPPPGAKIQSCLATETCSPAPGPARK